MLGKVNALGDAVCEKVTYSGTNGNYVKHAVEWLTILCWKDSIAASELQFLPDNTVHE